MIRNVSDNFPLIQFKNFLITSSTRVEGGKRETKTETSRDRVI
jgi:hypothetical protein